MFEISCCHVCYVIDGVCVTVQLLLLVQKLSEVAEQVNNSGSFTVSGKLLPSYITLRTAEKILFVGESVHMFSSQAQTDSSSRDVGKFIHVTVLMAIFQFNFTNRVNPVWKSLPNHVVSADTSNTFKTHLDKFWSDQEVLYDYNADLHGNRSLL